MVKIELHQVEQSISTSFTTDTKVKECEEEEHGNKNENDKKFDVCCDYSMRLDSRKEM